MVFDRAGNLYFSDTFNNRIRRVDAASGIITTIAGNGEKGFGGDGGKATGAALNEPYGIAIDRAGNVYIADRLNRRVRRVDAGTGVIATVAGTGEAAYSGDGGSGVRAGLAEPNGLAFDPAQARLYITDVADNRVRVIDIASGHHRHLRRHGCGGAQRRRRPGARGRHVRGAGCAGRDGWDGVHPRTAREFVCARSTPSGGSSRRSPGRRRAGMAAMAGRRWRRCSTRRRKWRSTPTATS